MTHDPAHAHRHRRERRARRQANKVLTAAVAAIGGGTPEDWPQEALEGVQDWRNNFSGPKDAPVSQRATGGQKSGVSVRPATPTGDSA